MQQWRGALIILAVAALTDILDGYFARLFDDHTLLGALLDPIADKMLTIGSFFALVYIQRLPFWFFMLALTKELLQLVGAGSFLYRYHDTYRVQATWLGKAAMVGQTVLISWVLCIELFPWLPLGVEWLLVLVVSLLMIASLLYYGCIGVHYFIWGVRT